MFAFLFFLATPPEKIDEDRTTRLFQNAAEDMWMMIDAGMLEDVERCAAAALGVRDTPNDRGDAGKDNRARTHRARFLRHVKARIGKTPIAARRERGRKG